MPPARLHVATSSAVGSCLKTIHQTLMHYQNPCKHSGALLSCAVTRLVERVTTINTRQSQKTHILFIFSALVIILISCDWDNILPTLFDSLLGRRAQLVSSDAPCQCRADPGSQLAGGPGSGACYPPPAAKGSRRASYATYLRCPREG